jgi:hypothetical protein
MGSIAMDQAGNIAMGYSVSSSGTYPAIAYTGRLATDALGTMGAETLLMNGTGAQTKNLHRWGDYSSLAVDPVDDCTFWYTTEYLKNSGSFNWSTRIGSFKFPGCGTSGYTLSASPASVNSGANITVSWTAPSGSSATDWIGLFATGSPNTAPVWRQYTGGAASGTASVAAPATAGTYEFRYLLNNTYTDVARSNPISVTAVGPVISGVSAGAITANSATISWMTDVPSDSQVDYGTALPYSFSSPLNSTLVTAHSVALSGLSASTTYHYRVKSRNSAGVLSVSGDFTFTTAGATPTYTLSASPSSVAGGATVTVTWTAPAGSSPYDWVALFATGASNTAYLAWQYTGGAASGSFSVAAPLTAGTYEFRYLLNNGYTDVARSNTVTVTAGTYTVTATPATVQHGSTITVNWTAPSGHSPYDWIGLYATGTANTQFLWWTYTGNIRIPLPVE